jgi:hypothetical protein
LIGGLMGNDLLSVLNTVMAAMAAVMNLWGALRTSVLIRRVARIVVVIISMYVGAIYTAYLLDMVTSDELGAIFLRPALLVMLLILAIMPIVDLLDPVERLRIETGRTISDLSLKYDVLQHQMAVIIDRLGEAQKEVRRLKDELSTFKAGHGDSRYLLVAVGDADFDVDLAALRKAQRVAGLSFVRISPTSRGQLERKIERDRALGRPVRWLHLSAHSSRDGVLFADGMGTWDWLSEILAGVEVMVVAGCLSDRAVDLLGVVPYVIAFSEEIENRDATLFAEAFWTAMAQHADVDLAVDIALDRCPPVLREIIERSW